MAVLTAALFLGLIGSIMVAGMIAGLEATRDYLPTAGSASAVR